MFTAIEFILKSEAQKGSFQILNRFLKSLEEALVNEGFYLYDKNISESGQSDIDSH